VGKYIEREEVMLDKRKEQMLMRNIAVKRKASKIKKAM
jgi:hypothetical protein